MSVANSQSELRIKNWPNFALRTPSSSISFSIKSCREIVSLSMFRQNPKFDPKWPLPTDFDLDPFDSDFFLWFWHRLKCSKMHFFTKFLISGDRFTPPRIYNFSQSHFKNGLFLFISWNFKSFTRWVKWALAMWASISETRSTSMIRHLGLEEKSF